MHVPNEELLRRFAVGLSDFEEANFVANWLAENPAAAQTIKELADEDTWIQAIRESNRFETIAQWNENSALPDVPDVQKLTGNREGLAVDSDAFAPTKLGQFRITSLLGRGGMGLVCEAVDEHLNRTVAIKVMNSDLMCVEEHRKRFLQEARAVAAVEHDSIVPILSFGESGGVNYLVMPRLRGDTLANRLLLGPLSLPLALRIATDISAGMEAAHSVGIVHRDVKPSNIWLERSEDGSMKRARLLDFGLALNIASDEPLTVTRRVMGTPGYLSPEQARGESGDIRSDIFSLGCVIYESIVGKRPFSGDTLLEILYNLANSTPPPIGQLSQSVPAELSLLVERMLAKSPELRPQSMPEVLAELRKIAQQLTIDANDSPGPLVQPKLARTPRRNSSIGLGVLGIGLSIVLLGVLVTIRHPDGKQTIVAVGENTQLTIDGSGDIAITVGNTAANQTQASSLVRLLEIGAKVRIRLANGIEVDANHPNDLIAGASIVAIVTAGNSALDNQFFAEYIAPLESLERLDMPRSSSLLDPHQVFADISKLRNLTYLVTTLPLDDHGCKLLSLCTRLVALHGPEPIFTEAGARQLLRLQQLQNISFGPGNASDEALAILLELPELNAFTIAGADLRGSILAGDTLRPKIAALNLSGCRFIEDPLPHLVRFPNLEHFSFQRLHHPGHGLVHLENLQHLKDVNLQESRIYDLEVFSALGRIPRLASLNLHACPLVSDEQIQAFINSQPSQLRALDLAGTRITDASLEAIASIPGLEMLVLYEVNVSDAGFAKLAKSDSLIHLTISSKQLTSETIRALAARSAPWHSIWIGECQLSDHAIDDLARFRGLRKLRISGSQISPTGLKRLKALLPKTEVSF